MNDLETATKLLEPERITCVEFRAIYENQSEVWVNDRMVFSGHWKEAHRIAQDYEVRMREQLK